MPQSLHPLESDTTTDGIRVRAAAHYEPEQSDPERNHYVFHYRIVLENVGDQPAQLERRHWIVRDASGERRDVEGPGVVGKFPLLRAGERFDYVSGCPLTTEWGTMEGIYRFRRVPSGVPFEVAVGRFYLVASAPPLAQRGR